VRLSRFALAFASAIAVGPAIAAKHAARVHWSVGQSPNTWRVGWGTVLDAYDIYSRWNAHPTRPGASSAHDATYRFIVRPTISGTAVRLRLVNATNYGPAITGTHPVTINAIDVGLREGSRGANILRGTNHAVTFSGRGNVTLRRGASALSDPVTMNVPRLAEVAVSVYTSGSQPGPPLHPQTYGTQFVTADGAGNHAGQLSGTAFTKLQEPIYWLDAVDLLTTAPRSIVAIGDSITDGDQCANRIRSACQYNDDFGIDRHPTYPDFLAARIASATRLPETAVINEGSNGTDSFQTAGQLQHDVLDLPGVTDAIIEVGTNDLPGRATASIIANMTRIARTLHLHRITILFSRRS